MHVLADLVEQRDRLGDQMGGLVRFQLARFEKLLADRRLTLDLDDSALAWLADRGYDPDEALNVADAHTV